MAKIFLHIGYPKCASTFLQKAVFPEVKNMDFYDKGSDVCKRIRDLEPVVMEKDCIISDESILGEFLLSKEAALRRIIFFVSNNIANDITIVCIERPVGELLRSLHAEWVSWGSMVDSLKVFLNKIHSGYYQDKFDISILDINFFIQKFHEIGIKFVLINIDVFRSVNSLNIFFAKQKIDLNISKIVPVRMSFHKITITIQRHFNKLIFSRFNPAGIIKNKKAPYISFWFFSRFDRLLRFCLR